MKKYFISLSLLIFFFPLSSFALTDYTCYRHGGVDCALGEMYNNGFAMCADGTTDQSKSYYAVCPTNKTAPSTTVIPETYYIPTYTQTIQEAVDDHMGDYCRNLYGYGSYWSGKPKEICLCQDGFQMLPLNGKTECRTKYQFCKDALYNGHYSKEVDECVCDTGFETIGGECVSPELLDRACKKSIDEHAIFKQVVNDKSVCGCDVGYELTNGRCLLTQTKSAVINPVVPVVNSVIKPIQTQQQIKTEELKPEVNNTDNSVQSTTSLERSSTTDAITNFPKPASRTQKFWGWVKRIFGF